MAKAGRKPDDPDAPRQHPRIREENEILIELMRRMTWRERVRYADRILARALGIKRR